MPDSEAVLAEKIRFLSTSLKWDWISKTRKKILFSRKNCLENFTSFLQTAALKKKMGGHQFWPRLRTNFVLSATFHGKRSNYFIFCWTYNAQVLASLPTVSCEWKDEITKRI